ncbi:MAG TPA: glutathionylspermidine synthase family protein [Campylobacterales bacterium]|nr:glutathionylspermidine synthase family protein [Campylobacterales bacterium]HIP60388.1 glutathionylspermidine synthase family protein [Campylobacterales bacterium]
MKLQKVEPLSVEFLKSIDFSWHTDEDDDTPYLVDELIEVSEEEAEAYAEAANELYDMYVEAGDYVIENDLLHDINIPFNLVEIIKESWENDVHWHLYSRFDFAGGLDGAPIKLLEFNADTPTVLLDTAIAQWAILKKNKMDEERQFNNIHQAIKENFQRLVTLEESVENFGEYYDGWKILFSSIKGAQEDEDTTKYLESIAKEAGFETAFAYLEDVEFSEEDGIFYNDENYEFFFKLVPWEDIAIDEGGLATILTQIVNNKKAIILNPAYTLMFQSKAFMKILWDLYPNHPLLLETDFEPLEGAHVQKPAFGREGENVTIIDDEGEVFDSKEGHYENFMPVFQEFTELNRDDDGAFYHAGVFFAYEGCGLGFRKAVRPIIDDDAKFAGHVIKG